MTTAIGGSIESISIGGRTFSVAADADVSRQLGGYTAEVQSNGDGTARKIISRVPWILGGLSVEVNDDRDDHKYLNDVAGSSGFEPITITLASKVTYMGVGTIVDEIEFSSESATAEITLSGPGELTQQ